MDQFIVQLGTRCYVIPRENCACDAGGCSVQCIERKLTWKVVQAVRHDAPLGPFFHLLHNGRLLQDDVAIPAGPCVHLTAHYRGGLKGGKGGFGANLRSSGKGGAATLDFSMCRDLNGRRLKIVNDELRLRAWSSSGEASKRSRLGSSYQEPAGEHGIRGWLLGVPAWAEGVKKVRTDLIEAAQARKKTRVCRDWSDARAGGRVPPRVAAPWWGCPRGPRCEFAHGEGELKSHSAQEAAAARKEAARARVDAYVERALGSIALYGGGDEEGQGQGQGRSMMAAVQAGIAAASSAGGKGKRSRQEAGLGWSQPGHDPAPPPLLCLRPSHPPPPTGAEYTPCALSPLPLPWADYEWALPTAVEGLEPSVHVSYEGGSTAVVEGVAPFGTALLAACALLLPPGPGIGTQGGTSFMYQVQLLHPSAQPGIVQVGWAALGTGTMAFTPHAEAGLGVGDDGGSWGVDPARGIAWHTPPPSSSRGGSSTGSGHEGQQQEEEGEEEDAQQDGTAQRSFFHRASSAGSGSSSKGGDRSSSGSSNGGDVLAGLREYTRGAVPYGPLGGGATEGARQWEEGAVLTCCCTVVSESATLTLSYALDGVDWGVAHTLAHPPGALPALVPALSLDAGEAVRLCVGAPWLGPHPYMGAVPVGQGAATAHTQADQPEAATATPAAAAAASGTASAGAAATSTLAAPSPSPAGPASSTPFPSASPSPSFDPAPLLSRCRELLLEALHAGGEEAQEAQRAALYGPHGPLYPPRLAALGCTPSSLGPALAALGCKTGGTLQQRVERLAACMERQDIPKQHRGAEK